MSDYKYICEFNYCRTHQECLYKNASAILKNHPCKAKVGQEENANIIICYENKSVEYVYEGEHKHAVRCQNPKCNLIAEAKFNGVINLCYKCIDTLREWRTNYELGTIFKTKEKLLTLFKVIEELTPKREPNRDMVRCSNIYCGTLDKMTRHHLIPKPFRGGESVEKIPLCEDCHKKVHQLASNTQLAKYYYTKQSVIELLARDIVFRKERVLSAYENNVMAVA